MLIRSIQLVRFPGMNAGANWDENDGPDIYFRLFDGAEPLAQPILDFKNADASQDYYFFIDDIFIRNVFTEHTLQLRDYDPADDDDIMGEVKFIPYDALNNFPEKIILDNGGDIAFTLEVEYLYNKKGE